METPVVAGISIATIALILSIICFIWVALHIAKGKWGDSEKYPRLLKADVFNGQ
jgi:hypothetical protein